ADLAFGGLDRFRPCPVARASSCRRTLVTRPAQECGNLFLDGSLQHQPSSNPPSERSPSAPCGLPSFTPFGRNRCEATAYALVGSSTDASRQSRQGGAQK